MKKTLTVTGIIFLALMTILRLYHISSTQVTGDEAYYYVWTNHLSWGYIDGGPTIAFINKLFVLLFGVNGFSIRIGAVLLSTASAIYLWIWGTRRFSPLTGFLLLLLVTVTPVCFLSSIIHTYDTEMAVFMLVAIALYYDAYFVDTRFFYLAGFALGLALLSKISVLFPAIGIFIVPFVFAPMRHLLRKKEFYISFLLAGLIFSPFIMWNFTHDFAFIRYKGGMAYRKGDLGDFVDVWAAQIALYSPVIFWFAIVRPFSTVVTYLRTKQAPMAELYFSLVGIVPVLYFGIGSLFSRYYGNWVAPAFFGGLFLAAVTLGRQAAKARGPIRFHAAFSVVLLGIALGQLYFSFLPLRRDPITSYYPYSEISGVVKQYFQTHPELQGIRIVGNNYQIPSLVNFYLRPQLEATGLSLGDYHDTLYTMLYPGKTLAGLNFLFLCGGEEFSADWRPYFNTVEKQKTFIGKQHEILTLWYVTGYRGRT
ncbi:MAG TPA: glycosyltransferase family 39 protein [Armatimonadota bacterium]|nr:glycosyltransferase family 39 protein [Armatimonadota bacterium]